MSTSQRTNAGVSHGLEGTHTSVQEPTSPVGQNIRQFHHNDIQNLHVDRDERNPLQHEQITDHDRAALFHEFDRIIAQVAPDRRYMPTKPDSKAPAISGMGSGALETDKAREMLHTPREAKKAISEGQYGFVLYAGRVDHGTDDLCFIDYDDLDTLHPDETPQSLTVMSGSGGFHRTYVNDGSIGNASPEFGEVRANNWYVVVSGSRHESGGVYHVYREHPIMQLSHGCVRKADSIMK